MQPPSLAHLENLGDEGQVDNGVDTRHLGQILKIHHALQDKKRSDRQGYLTSKRGMGPHSCDSSQPQIKEG